MATIITWWWQSKASHRLNYRPTFNFKRLKTIQNRIVCRLILYAPKPAQILFHGWLIQRGNLPKTIYFAEGVCVWYKLYIEKQGRNKGGGKKRRAGERGINRTQQVQTCTEKNFQKCGLFRVSSPCVLCFGHTLLILSHIQLRWGCQTSWREN